MKRIYISGPMTGMPNHNFPAFHAEAARLRDLGYEVTNPADINPEPDNASWHECLRNDLAALLGCDAVALLDGWENSMGAKFEVDVALRLGMEVIAAKEIVEPLPAPKPGTLRPQEPKITVSITLRRSEHAKLHAFMSSETFREADRLRNARIEDCTASLSHCVDFTFRNPGTSGGRVFATFLASLYNGYRIKADVSDIRRLDSAAFEHLMNAMRLVFETNREPHTFFTNGGELFEQMIKDWGLEKRKRRAA